MRRRIGGLCVDQRRLLHHGSIEKFADVAWVMLAVLVQRHDPVTTRGRHPGQRRGVLPEVAAQPDWTNRFVLVGQVADDSIGPVRPVVVDQQHFRDHEPVTAVSYLLLEQRGDLRNKIGKSGLAPVHRNNDTDLVWHSLTLWERPSVSTRPCRQHAA